MYLNMENWNAHQQPLNGGTKGKSLLWTIPLCERNVSYFVALSPPISRLFCRAPGGEGGPNFQNEDTKKCTISYYDNIVSSVFYMTLHDLTGLNMLQQIQVPIGAESGPKTSPQASSWGSIMEKAELLGFEMTDSGTCVPSPRKDGTNSLNSESVSSCLI